MNTDNYKGKPRDTAYEKLENYLVKNNYPPHYRLPGERDMCEMWNLSRTTLRAAISRLVIEGKLYRKKGSGTYVAPPKLIEDLQKIHSFAKLSKSDGRIPETKLISMELCPADKKIAGKLGLSLGEKVWQLVRIRMADTMPVRLENVFLPEKLFKKPDQNKLTAQSLYDMMEEDYGLRPEHGAEKIALAYATEREAQLLEVEAGAPLFYISGITRTKDEVAVEYYKNVVRGDMVRYQGVLRDGCDNVCV